MDEDHYSGPRLNALRGGPGMLDALYDLFLKTKNLKGIFFQQSRVKEPNLSLVLPAKHEPNIPDHIHGMDKELVYVASDILEKLITPFCKWNNIEPIRPAASFFSSTTVALRRSEIDSLQSIAVRIVADPNHSAIQDHLARRILADFECLDHCIDMPVRFQSFRTRRETPIEHNLI